MSANETQQTVIYREASEADFPAVELMYAKLDELLRQYTYTFPAVENVGRPVAGDVPPYAGSFQHPVCR